MSCHSNHFFMVCLNYTPDIFLVWTHSGLPKRWSPHLSPHSPHLSPHSPPLSPHTYLHRPLIELCHWYLCTCYQHLWWPEWNLQSLRWDPRRPSGEPLWWNTSQESGHLHHYSGQLPELSRHQATNIKWWVGTTMLHALYLNCHTHSSLPH